MSSVFWSEFSTLIIVSVIGLISLFIAYVSFRFLDSMASINTDKKRIGGAFAGFIIAYGTIFGAYQWTSSNQCSGLSQKVVDLSGQLQQRQIIGRIEPATVQFAQVILAVQTTTPDGTGQFQFNASCLDPKKNRLGVYVVTPDQYRFKNIYELDQMKNLVIKFDDAQPSSF